MRRNTLTLTAVIFMMAASASYGQCNQGSQSASGRFRPIASNGLNTSTGTFSPSSSSPMAAYLANQYGSQLAQQRYLRAQQQLYMQSLAMQQMLNRNASRVAIEPDAVPNGSRQDEDRPANLRRETLKLQNAEKAFETAKSAEAKGRQLAAEKGYRKVVRILGEDDALGRRAADAIVTLPQRMRDLREREMLVASNAR